MEKRDLIKINDLVWEIAKDFRPDMRVPCRIYSSEIMLDEIFKDRSLDQLVNVAALPGIQKYALAMPDMHEGYGFPIGGVAAFDAKEGIISPGGIGYDINCGVRLIKSDKVVGEIKPFLEKLGREIYKEVPSGVGKGGRLKLGINDLNAVLQGGAPKMLEFGYGAAADLENTESRGFLSAADASMVSKTAKDRGSDQLGTMGAGNHFVEVEAVDEIFDGAAAEKLGLFKDQVVISIHMGSRGLGHQVATDHIKIMLGAALKKYKIDLPDRELACVPFNSEEGRNYFAAMCAAANFAWANRQFITYEIRKAWSKIFGNSDELKIIYDVAHNIAKIEEYDIGGKKKQLIVHRKGATRSFLDQPVLIPGSMGTASYVLLGQEKALEETFGSTCHGAGRTMSRAKAKKQIRGSELKKRLNEKGIVVNSGSLAGLAEEAPEAYKDVDSVVNIVERAGIAKRVAKLRPLAVIKG